jgi:UDP-2-acetamido-2,6-beta-L-arabino-hexul-4-ose reductase
MIKRTDERGWLIQNEYEDVSSQMKHFFVSMTNKKAVRGQHYHTHKKEWFIVLIGSARIILEDINSKKRSEKILSADNPEMIEISPNVAHAIENVANGDMLLLALVNEAFDPKNPDTYAYKII